MPFAMRNGIGCALAVAFAALIIHAPSTIRQAPSSGALPDVVGIRPGISIGEAYQLLKAHDPKGIIQYGQKRIEAISEKPITHAFAYSATGRNEDPEIIVVDITFPPSPQTVWRVSRFVRFEPGKEPVPETLLTALRQKYGQSLPSKGPQSEYWVFDAQGHPARSTGLDLSDCAGFVEHQIPGIPGQNGIPAGVALYPTGVVANRDACHSFVYVNADFSHDISRGVVLTVTVTITDLGAGIRAGNATVAVMNNKATAEQQRAMKKAKEQPAPVF